MTYKIHGTAKDGTEDWIAIHGETIEEIRNQAREEIEKRSWKDCWSEEGQPS